LKIVSGFWFPVSSLDTGGTMEGYDDWVETGEDARPPFNNWKQETGN
jgi:hypothetical protein